MFPLQDLHNFHNYTYIVFNFNTKSHNTMSIHIRILHLYENATFIKFYILDLTCIDKIDHIIVLRLYIIYINLK